MAPFTDCGTIYIVPDEVIQLPEENLPGAGPRNLHEGRPFLVLQSQELCNDANYHFVLGAPVSTKIQYKKETDFILLKQDSGGLKFDSVVLLSHIQPILKSDLGRQAGKVSNLTLEKIRALHLVGLGIIKR